ncbi:M56 family metallopeptidase [Lewinella sp. W8]|uniref:M56 family metallopeptidase n=1 Tax=Lewinella sp. W8 TaxID=2528208 RepID=UPI0010689B00|nr:M56 family metallopeptidase [Lewinella sp. W8]MTB52622.1 hypothetical protein [Lewinella sp. W8]
MITYLLKASIVLLCLPPAYWLLLRFSDRYQLNRFLLLLGVAATLLLPVLPLPSPLPPASETIERLIRETPVFTEVAAVTAPTESVTIIPAAAPATSPVAVPPAVRAWTPNYLHLYGLISGLLLSLLTYKLARMWLIHRRSAALPGYAGCRLLEAGASAGQAFTFGRTVYLSADLLGTRDLPLILRHERIHARQLHALDILIGELFLCFFWFHPGAWWLRRAQRANLEYLADEGALKQTGDRRAYQLALVRQSIAGQQLALALPFSEPSLKRRIEKMGQRRKQKMVVGLAAMGLMGWLVVATFLINGRETAPVLFPGADSVAQPGGAGQLIENHAQVYANWFDQNDWLPERIDKFELYFRRLPTPEEYAQIKAVLHGISKTNFSIYHPCYDDPESYVVQLDHYFNIDAASEPLREGELLRDHRVLKLVPNGPLGADRSLPHPVVGRFTPELKYTTTASFFGEQQPEENMRLLDYRMDIEEEEIALFVNNERFDFVDGNLTGLPAIRSYKSIPGTLPVPPNARLGCLLRDSRFGGGIQKYFWNDVEDHREFAETTLAKVLANNTNRAVHYFHNEAEMSRTALFSQDFPRETIIQLGYRPNDPEGEIIVQIIDDMPWN